MALKKTNIGTNEDGSTRWHYEQTDPSVPVVLTGPITGSVKVGSTTYDVSEPVIEVKSEAHAAAVAEEIGKRFEAEGHPDHTDGEPFAYTPSEG